MASPLSTLELEQFPLAAMEGCAVKGVCMCDWSCGSEKASTGSATMSSVTIYLDRQHKSRSVRPIFARSCMGIGLSPPSLPDLTSMIGSLTRSLKRTVQSFSQAILTTKKV